MSNRYDRLVPSFDALDLTDAFTTTEIFHSREDLVRWVTQVSNTHKVITIIRRSETTDGGKGTHNKIIFKCVRWGKYKHVVDIGCSSRRRSSKKCDCPFQLNAKPLDPPFRDWKVTVRCGIHNHLANETMEGTKIGRFLKDEVSQVAEHLWLNVKAGKSLNAVKDRFPLNLSSITQLYRLRVKLRKDKRGSKTEIQDLLTKIEEHRYLSWSRKLDGTNIIEEIMWAHADSIKLLRMFPQVLVMDCTFKTNKYCLPLLEVVGVTSTNITFNVVFAYLSHERYGDYTWALGNLREVMMQSDIELPKVILTDQEDGLMKAIRDVFPESTNLLCSYHIKKNVEARLKKTYKLERRKTTMQLFRNIVDSCTETEYNQAWDDFRNSTYDKPLLADYIWNQWLKDHKERFCGPWTDRVRHLGNTTTNRYAFSNVLTRG